MKAPEEQLALPLNLESGDHGTYCVGDRQIVFKPETTKAEWENITGQLANVCSHTAIAHVRLMFLLGDALNFGERTYGEEAAQAIDATREHMRLSVKTIENAAWVASKVSPANRHELLSMAHHEAVARLTDEQQKTLLDEAQAEALPVSKLRAKVREASPQRPKKLKPKKVEKGQDKDIVTLEDATEHAAKLAEFAAVYTGRKASEITPAIRKALDEYMSTVYAFARRFVRKSTW